jgi:hypothetical protein
MADDPAVGSQQSAEAINQSEYVLLAVATAPILSLLLEAILSLIVWSGLSNSLPSWVLSLSVAAGSSDSAGTVGGSFKMENDESLPMRKGSFAGFEGVAFQDADSMELAMQQLSQQQQPQQEQQQENVHQGNDSFGRNPNVFTRKKTRARRQSAENEAVGQPAKGTDSGSKPAGKSFFSFRFMRSTPQ